MDQYSSSGRRFIEGVLAWRDVPTTGVVTKNRLHRLVQEQAAELSQTVAGRAELALLMTHDVPAVRYYAAAWEASEGNSEGVRVLESIRDGDGDCSLHAMTLLLMLADPRSPKAEPNSIVQIRVLPATPEVEAAGRFHGLAMNGGVEHAIRVNTEDAVRAVDGFREAGLQIIADIVDRALTLVRGNAKGLDVESLLAEIDDRYSEIARDESVFSALERA